MVVVYTVAESWLGCILNERKANGSAQAREAIGRVESKFQLGVHIRDLSLLVQQF